MQENQRTRITKIMLKDSLISLLHKENIHKLTVTKICEDAQINRTTFYKYYGSQYDLLEEIERDALNQIRSYVEVEVDGEDSGNIHQLTKTFSFFSDNIELFKLLLSNNVNPDFPEKLVLSLQNIPRLTSRQVPEKYGNDEFDYIFEFMINGGFSFIKRWINKENRESPEEIAVLLDSLIIKLLNP